MSGGRRSAATGRDGKGTSRLDVVFEQLMTGALFDDPGQQSTQGLLFVGAQLAGATFAAVTVDVTCGAVNCVARSAA